MEFLNPEERKEIIGPFLKDAKVNWGNLALAGLIKENYFGRVLTFNFDPVHVKACGIVGHYPAIYDFSQVPDAKGDFSYIAPSAILHLHGQGTSLTMMHSEAQTKEHAVKLQPLFNDTLRHFDVIVIGYSGEADAAFDTLKAARSNRRITWCTFENTAADQVKVLINDCGNMGERFEEVDFDEFMIDLATELKCFPPLLFTSTTEHIKAEIAHIIEPPDSLKGTVGWLSHMQEKLKAWRKSKNSLKMQLRNALLRDTWEAAIAFEGKVKLDVEKELLAWAYIMQGIALSDQAKLEQDEVLFQRSFKTLEAALKIKPDKHEALSNCGNALAALAEAKGNDEVLWREAIAKYEQALVYKPDMHEALDNWGVALAALYHKTKDTNLLR